MNADPHPGNLAVDPVDGGRIIYYDFGKLHGLLIGSPHLSFLFTKLSQCGNLCQAELREIGTPTRFSGRWASWRLKDSSIALRAGMMGTIPSDVRSGLLELFYGVYQKDPDRCIDALITMGVLVPGGDRLSIRRTAEFFLQNFQVRPFLLAKV